MNSTNTVINYKKIDYIGFVFAISIFTIFFIIFLISCIINRTKCTQSKCCKCCNLYLNKQLIDENDYETYADI